MAHTYCTYNHTYASTHARTHTHIQTFWTCSFEIKSCNHEPWYTVLYRKSIAWKVCMHAQSIASYLIQISFDFTAEGWPVNSYRTTIFPSDHKFVMFCNSVWCEASKHEDIRAHSISIFIQCTLFLHDLKELKHFSKLDLHLKCPWHSIFCKEVSKVQHINKC